MEPEVIEADGAARAAGVASSSDGHQHAESEAPPYKCKWLQPMMAGDLKREASAACREWLVGDLLPRGSTIIFASYAKVGKSTFLYPMLVAISQGKPFMGLTTKKTPVLILSEEPPDVIQERLEALGCVENDPYLMVHALPRDIDAVALLEIKMWMEKARGGLLIVDTISEYAGIQDDSNNAEIARKLLPLKRLQREHKSTLFYVHHDRKNGEDADEGKMIRGGGEYLAIVDQAFMMARTGGDGSRRRVIRSIGRYRTIPPRIEVEWDGNVDFDLVSADVKATGPAKTGAEVKVWKVLPVAPAEGLTIEEVSRQVSLHRVTVQNILKPWEETGYSISTGTGIKGDPKRYNRNAVVPPSSGIRPHSLQNEIAAPKGDSQSCSEPALTAGGTATTSSSNRAKPIPTGESLRATLAGFDR